jgi:hypothetical protein
MSLYDILAMLRNAMPEETDRDEPVSPEVLRALGLI